jgi:hypothetical protein
MNLPIRPVLIDKKQTLLGRKECQNKVEEIFLTGYNDSIIKEGKPEAFDTNLHARPPYQKKDLKYNRFRQYEAEIIEDHKINSDDDFQRINITSTLNRRGKAPRIDLIPSSKINAELNRNKHNKSGP